MLCMQAVKHLVETAHMHRLVGADASICDKSGAFLGHFTEYTILSGSGGTPSVLGQG